MSAGVQFHEDLACGECGKFGAFDFGDAKLCGECYENSGSCGPGLGRDETNDTPAVTPRPK